MRREDIKQMLKESICLELEISLPQIVVEYLTKLAHKEQCTFEEIIEVILTSFVISKMHQ